MHPHHLHWYVRVVNWTSLCLASSSHTVCLMMFVFLGSEFCLQLPSDSTSRWTPLLLASGWQLQAPTADFHRLVNRHAWRTKKKTTRLSGLLLAYLPGYSWCKHSLCDGLISMILRMLFALASASSSVSLNPKASKVPAATVPVRPFPPPQ